MEGRMEMATTLIETKDGTAVVIPTEILDSAHLARGDEVTLAVKDGVISITRKPSGDTRVVEDDYNEAMEIGLRFAAEFSETMAALAKS
jgi:antitoxin component of MazEF toxin-antitoxin module